MPRLRNSIPTYRLHRASGQAVVTLSGRDHYLGPHGTRASKLEYDRLIAEWLEAGRSPSFGVPAAQLTVADLLLKFLDFAASYYGTKPRSEYHHFVRIGRPLNRLYGKKIANEFGPQQLKVIRQTLVNDGCSRNHTNALTRRLKYIFRWAGSEGLVTPIVPQALSMVDGLKKGRTEARETEAIQPIEDATVEATLPHLPAVLADMVRLQRLTGMRPAELCIMRPCDLDRSGEVWTYRPASHKTEHHGRDRIIFIGPKAQSILLRYLARDAEAYCFSPVDSEAKRLAELHADRKTPMSCGNRPGSKAAKRGRRKRKKEPGNFYTTCSYRRAIHRACDRAFPHPELGRALRSSFTDAEKRTLREWQSAHRWSPNQLRHSAATEIRREFGLEAAQVALGHATANVTQVYAERDLAKGIEVARRIG